MKRRIKKKAAPCKPNVIPILDAVFIFIFFLLMSAQFLEIYEIGSDAPAVKTVSEDQPKDKKPPLNLTLEVKKQQIIVKTGLDGNIHKTVGIKDGNYDLEQLAQVLVTLKKGHVSETSVIIRPDSAVEYKKIVYIMDTCRELPKQTPSIIAKNDKGVTVETRTLFEQIIFETIM
jgi:biopolymer transport protein ExbD